jgi:hypothetical protein
MERRSISYAPRHRRDRRRFWLWCICGLRWPCPDRFTKARASTSAPHWNAPTEAHPNVGRTGRLTAAGQWRANRGRW